MQRTLSTPVPADRNNLSEEQPQNVGYNQKKTSHNLQNLMKHHLNDNASAAPADFPETPEQHIKVVPPATEVYLPKTSSAPILDSSIESRRDIKSDLTNQRKGNAENLSTTNGSISEQLDEYAKYLLKTHKSNTQKALFNKDVALHSAVFPDGCLDNKETRTCHAQFKPGVCRKLSKDHPSRPNEPSTYRNEWTSEYQDSYGISLYNFKKVAMPATQLRLAPQSMSYGLPKMSCGRHLGILAFYKPSRRNQE